MKCIVFYRPLVLAALAGIPYWYPPAAQAGSPARQAEGLFEADGQVKDPAGLPVPNASAYLSLGSRIVTRTRTDGNGRFHLRGTAAGTATVHIVARGFEESSSEVEFSHEHPRADLAIRLVIAAQHTVVDVDEAPQGGVTAEARQAGGLVLRRDDLAALPDDPEQLMRRLQFLAASSGGAPGSAEVKVDGFLNPTSLPSKSSIREVRINPDQYSAQYQRPPLMSGLIEVSTKPGTDGLQGSLFFSGNDAFLNAREPFAPTRASSNTERYGFELTGPIKRGKSSFTVNLERRQLNQFGVVNAVSLNPQFQPVATSSNVAAPQQLWLGGVRADWQLTAGHSLTIGYNVNQRNSQNEDVEGLVTPDAGHWLAARQHDLRITELAAFGPTLLNEAHFGVYLHKNVRDPNSISPEIIIPGVFEGGGSPLQSLDERGRKFEFNDVLSLNRKTQTLRAGIQYFHDRLAQLRTDGFNGTLLFAGGLAPGLANDGGAFVDVSGLEQYRRWLTGLPGGTPTSTTYTLGNPRLGISQSQAAAFFQDDWRPNGRLSLGAGIRYEAQTSPLIRGDWSPRLSLAYALDQHSRWVIRVRAGLFYRPLDEALALEALRLDGIHQVQTLTYAPLLPDAPAITVANQRALQAALRPSLSFQPQISLQRDFGHGISLQGSYTLVRTWREVRSRNINAPAILPGTADALPGPRPGEPNLNLFQYESTGRVYGNLFYVGFNQAALKHFTTFAGYIHMDFRGNADNPDLFPQSSGSNAGEWARPLWQSSHRVYAGGVLMLPWKVQGTFLVGGASGVPFNIITGGDNNGDGVFNDRPGLGAGAQAIPTQYGLLNPFAVNGSLPRNAGTSPALLTVDFNVSRRFTLAAAAPNSEHTRSLVVNLQGTNLTNHLNPSSVIGVVSSPLFGMPNTAEPARRIEAGLRFNF